jgi:hypothetical protein
MQSFIVEESLNSVTVFWLEQDRLIADIYKRARELGEEDVDKEGSVLFGNECDCVVCDLRRAERRGYKPDILRNE